MIKIAIVKASEEDLKKYSIARIIVSLITILGVRDIVKTMLQ
jgi:hypothetical protein